MTSWNGGDDAPANGPPEESEEAYRLRVYGTIETLNEDASGKTKRRSRSTTTTSFRRLSEKVSGELVRRRSSLQEALPDTTQGWMVLLSVLSSAILGYEINLQKSLTCPPTVFGQFDSGPMKDIYHNIITSKREDSFLLRTIQPSLFVGTRAMMSSAAAFFMGGPRSTKEHVRFREIFTMAADGARIAVDWELPISPSSSSSSALSVEQRKNEILRGPIQQPVVLILHGINNDSSFGYVRSLMRACTERGWVAAGMNFRGCGGVPLRTPRGYNGAYTGDLRGVVRSIAHRMGDNSRLFLVGNSLGANILTKYLGEEGLGGTLPKCVAGAVALGNPMRNDSSKFNSIFSSLMALGVKKTILMNWTTLKHMNNPAYRAAIRKALLAVTLADFDNAMAPLFVRNDSLYPYAFRVGYEDGQDYWNDASSFILSRHVSIPMMQLISNDDFLCYGPFLNRLHFLVTNPNIMVVQTKCGGHLGWQEAPPGGSNIGNIGTSWADVATTEFIEAVLETRRKRCEEGSSDHAPETREQNHEILQDDHEVSSLGEIEDTPLLISRL